MWTQFWDMNSGGGQKEKWSNIFIEAPQDEAEELFYRIFGHDPNNVTCQCCGEDYSIDNDESLNQLTGYHRGCDYVYKRPDGSVCSHNEAWQHGEGLKEGYWHGYIEEQSKERSYKKYQTIEDYINEPKVLVIFKHEIEEAERKFADSKKRIVGRQNGLFLEYFEKD